MPALTTRREKSVAPRSNPCGRSPKVEALEGRVLMAADVVLEWNSLALDALRNAGSHGGPAWASRNLAIVHAAMFDAVNAVDGSYEPYLVDIHAPQQTSMSVAAAVAADRVLDALYPHLQSTFDAALASDLAATPDNVRKTLGVDLGQKVADGILAARAGDGSETPSSYMPTNQPGHWQATPPDFSGPVGANWGGVTPFVVPDASDYVAPPPPDLTSADYAAAFDQVKRLGAANSTERTAEQTQIAEFWAYDRGAMGTPMVMFNEIAQTVARQQHNTLVENARMFALMNLAMGDAGIAAWDTKYIYDFWRPVTAIHNADQDGNDATTADPTWTPLGMPGTAMPNMTPPFPAYVSGHSTFGAAAFKVLADFYGSDKMHFTVSSDELPGVTRTFNRFSDAAAENGISRIYLGVHWSFDNIEGKKAGGAIGEYVFNHAMQRRPSHRPEDVVEAAVCPATGKSSLAAGENVFSSLLVGRKGDDIFG